MSQRRLEGGKMPDVSLVVQDFKDGEEAEKLERAVSRLEFVHLVNADPEKGLVAVSYEGGGPELEKIEAAIKDAGHGVEHSPGADKVAD